MQSVLSLPPRVRLRVSLCRCVSPLLGRCLCARPEERALLNPPSLGVLDRGRLASVPGVQMEARQHLGALLPAKLFLIIEACHNP